MCERPQHLSLHDVSPRQRDFEHFHHFFLMIFACGAALEAPVAAPHSSAIHVSGHRALPAQVNGRLPRAHRTRITRDPPRVARAHEQALHVPLRDTARERNLTTASSTRESEFFNKVFSKRTPNAPEWTHNSHPNRAPLRIQILLNATMSTDWMFAASPSFTSSSSMISSMEGTLASSITAVIRIFLMP